MSISNKCPDFSISGSYLNSKRHTLKKFLVSQDSRSPQAPTPIQTTGRGAAAQQAPWEAARNADAEAALGAGAHASCPVHPGPGACRSPPWAPG